MTISRFLLTFAFLLAAWVPAHAQIVVGLSIKRHLFIHHEPVIASVTVTNQSGRDITLADTPQLQWFSFQIVGQGDSIVAPRNPDYKLAPIEVKNGATVQRTVNLNELYSLGEFGIFRVRAAIYYGEQSKFYSSKNVAIEITEGKRIWKQTVGTPGGGATRTFTLLAHQVGRENLLYVRVEDPEQGFVLSTYQLGRLIEGQPPQAEFDAGNDLYILQLIAQRSFLLTKIGNDGAYISQHAYSAPKAKPYLRKLMDGQLQLVGGHREDPVSATAAAAPPGKISERPPGMPAN